MQTTKTPDANREKNGQYSMGLDATCKHCGHRKGEHTAEAPFEGTSFDCDGFKKARAK